ncbi:MAG: glycosyltransferase family 39 protein [Chloroflexota bacterium]
MTRLFGRRASRIPPADGDAGARYERAALWVAKHHGVLLAMLLAGSLASHLVALDSPPIPLFDEGGSYVPAGRAILAGLPDPNFEHPPLGKLATAAGMAVLGDNPWGWRITAAITGTVGVLFTYRLGVAVWGSVGAGLLAASLLSVDLLWLAFSRMAMLDIFLAGPLVAALSLALDFHHRRSRWALTGSGLCLGLAAGAKWSAAWAFPPVLVLVWLSRRQDGRGPGRYAAPAALFAASAVGYLGVWIAYGLQTGQEVSQLALRHLQMINYQVVAGGREESLVANLLAPGRWLLNEPLVLASRGDATHWQLLMSNPLVFWPGVAAAIWVAVRVARKRSTAEMFLLASALILYLPWFALPRIKYFYYLLPVLPLLTVAAGGGLMRLLPRPGLPLTRPARYRLLLVAAHLGLALAFWVGAFPAVTGMWRR